MSFVEDVIETKEDGSIFSSEVPSCSGATDVQRAWYATPEQRLEKLENRTTRLESEISNTWELVNQLMMDSKDAHRQGSTACRYRLAEPI
jgi:hypothetical protein